MTKDNIVHIIGGRSGERPGETLGGREHVYGQYKDLETTNQSIH